MISRTCSFFLGVLVVVYYSITIVRSIIRTSAIIRQPFLYCRAPTSRIMGLSIYGSKIKVRIIRVLHTLDPKPLRYL